MAGAIALAVVLRHYAKKNRQEETRLGCQPYFYYRR